MITALESADSVPMRSLRESPFAIWWPGTTCTATRRSEDLVRLFAEDGVLEYREGDVIEEFTGRDEIAAFLERIKVQWIAESQAESVSARVFHSVGTHVVDLLDDDHAVGEAYVTVLRHNGLAEWGRYRDRYVRHDGRWSFAFRRASLDVRVIGASLHRSSAAGR